MPGLGVWVARGARIAFLWMVGGLASLVLFLVLLYYLSHGHEYLRRNSPNDYWSAFATEGAWTYRVWVRRRGLEYSAMDQVWRSHGLKPVDLVWDGDDSLVVVLPRGTRRTFRVWLGKSDHSFLDLERDRQSGSLQYSTERIGVVTLVDGDATQQP